MRSEILFTGKGFQMVRDFGQTTSKTIARPTYLQIPLLIGFQDAKPKIKPFVFAGPYVSFGIGGTIRLLIDNKLMDERELTFGPGGNDDYSSIDFGLSLLAGLQLDKSIQVFLFADLGLINNFPDAIADLRSSHLTFGLGIGISPFTIGK